MAGLVPAISLRQARHGLRPERWAAINIPIALDSIPKRVYSPKCPAQPRGVVARRSDDGAAGRRRCRRCGIARSGAEGGRPLLVDVAPAGGARNPALGRSRDPTGGHYDPSARSFAGLRLLKVSDAARRDKAMSRTGAAERGKPSGNQEARTRDPKSPPWRAERRSLPATAGELEKGRADRRAIPSALRGERNGRRPRRGLKQYGRRSVGCLTFESAVCGRNHNLRSFPRKRESSSSCAGSANIAKALDPLSRG